MIKFHYKKIIVLTLSLSLLILVGCQQASTNIADYTEKPVTPSTDK